MMLDDSQMASGPTLEDYWAILCRRRWWLLLGVFVTWASVSITAWILAAEYRSETLILVEQQKVPEHYVRSEEHTSELQSRGHLVCRLLLEKKKKKKKKKITKTKKEKNKNKKRNKMTR